MNCATYRDARAMCVVNTRRDHQVAIAVRADRCGVQPSSADQDATVFECREILSLKQYLHVSTKCL